MELKQYAQINPGGVCVGLLETSGAIDAPHMVAIAPGAARLGQRWNGVAFVNVAVSEAEQAAVDLERIDRETGMSRTQREALILIADKLGVSVAYLKAKEQEAAAARLKRGG